MIEVGMDEPDERRDFPMGHLDVCELSGLTFGVAAFEPGWRWSESVKPIAGTESCEVHHNGMVVKGRLHIRMDDGAEAGDRCPARSSSLRPDTTPGSWVRSLPWCSISRGAPPTTRGPNGVGAPATGVRPAPAP